MKTRILSFVLAVLMVVSMAAVFSAASFAEDKAEGLTVYVGTTYVEPGEIAAVDVSIKADALPQTYTALVNWQFAFEGAQVSEAETFASVDTYAFVNKTTNTVGCTVDPTKGNVATKAELLRTVPAKIATVKFEIPEGVTEVEITIKQIETLCFNDGLDAAADATVVAGKIIVGEKPAVEEQVAEVLPEAEDAIIPEGATSVATGLTGSVGLLKVPASFTQDAYEAFENLEGVGAVIAKNDDTDLVDIAVDLYDDTPIPVYYQKPLDGESAIPGKIDALSKNNKKKVVGVNLLQVYNGAVVEGNKVSFVAGIAADDLDFVDIQYRMTFVADGNAKELFYKTDKVYTTVNGVASVDEATATAAGLVYVENCAYITAATITGVPAGTYEVALQLTATAAAADGAQITVTSDIVTVEVVVA